MFALGISDASRLNCGLVEPIPTKPAVVPIPALTVKVGLVDPIPTTLNVVSVGTTVVPIPMLPLTKLSTPVSLLNLIEESPVSS